MTPSYIKKLVELINNLDEASKEHLSWNNSDDAIMLEKIAYLTGFVHALAKEENNNN